MKSPSFLYICLHFSSDHNTLFRGNTLLTKLLDELLKLVGLPYLHHTLKPTIDQICTDHLPCEIDPTRLREGENINDNMVHVIQRTIFEPRHEITGFLHMRKQRHRSVVAVTAQLISAFVFTIRIAQSLYFLNPKFQVSSHFL